MSFTFSATHSSYSTITIRRAVSASRLLCAQPLLRFSSASPLVSRCPKSQGSVDRQRRDSSNALGIKASGFFGDHNLKGSSFFAGHNDLRIQLCCEKSDNPETESVRSH